MVGVVAWKDVGMVATHCAVMCGLSVYALRCALLLVSLVFGELFFGESSSPHDLFLHFLAKCLEVHFNKEIATNTIYPTMTYREILA